MRALAHPLRIELLDLLREGERTATQCAHATGQSPASCSFHLRTLAKYGFIEPAARSGRERPWRLVSPGHDFHADPEDATSVRAVGELARAWVDHAVDQVRHWIDVAEDEPFEWLEASTIKTGGVWVTLDELTEVSDTIRGVTDRFDGRAHDPSTRPPGARPVRVLAVVAPDTAWEARERAIAEERSAP